MNCVFCCICRTRQQTGLSSAKDATPQVRRSEELHQVGASGPNFPQNMSFLSGLDPKARIFGEESGNWKSPNKLEAVWCLGPDEATRNERCLSLFWWMILDWRWFLKCWCHRCRMTTPRKSSIAMAWTLNSCTRQGLEGTWTQCDDVENKVGKVSIRPWSCESLLPLEEGTV